MVNGWLRQRGNVLLLVGMAVLFLVVFWVGWKAAANARESAEDVKNATVQLCQQEIAYNELLDKLADLYQTAAPELPQARQQLFYLTLADTFREGKVDKPACRKLLADND